MTFLLGLTGSIGMGKSTTSSMFRAAGVPVHDADQAVHDLYAGAAAPQIEAAFPGTTVDGTVDRAKLSAAVLGRPQALATLEAIVHPLVRAEEQAFLARARKSGATTAVLDVPLLLETGGEGRCDAVVVVTAPADVQRKRVLGRSGMSEDKLAAPGSLPCGHLARARGRRASGPLYPECRRRPLRPGGEGGLTCARSFSIPRPPASKR